MIKIFFFSISLIFNLTILSQEYPLIDVTNIDKDTVYSLVDISLINGIIFDHYENDGIKLLIEYKDGIKNGDYKKWHSNGQLIFKGAYINGTEYGIFEEFDIYGKKLSKTKYKEGIVLWEKDFTEKYH